MRYNKYLLISILLSSFILSQSYFNRVIGNNIYSSDARSMAIGNTFATTGLSSNLILSNPARLTLVKDNITLDFQSKFRVLNERKSIITKDFFDGTLGEADIVFNQNTTFDYSFGMIYSRSLFNRLKFGLAYSYIPLISFDYTYEEEIREDIDLDDYNGVVNPHVGYHIYSTKGGLKIQSVGFSLAYINNKQNIPISIGVGVNKVLPDKIEDKFYIYINNPLGDMSNLSSINEESNIYDIKANEEYFISYSLNVNMKNRISIMYAYEDNIIVSSDNYSLPSFSPYIHLPLYLEFQGDCINTSNQEFPGGDAQLSQLDEESCNGYDIAAWIEQLTYVVDGLYYNKPKKHNLGFTFNFRSKDDMLLAIEFENKELLFDYSIWNCSSVQDYDYSESCNSNLIDDGAIEEQFLYKNDLFTFRFGFEHKLRKSFPVRLGFEYKEPIFKSLEPTTVFTLGTGINSPYDKDTSSTLLAIG